MTLANVDHDRLKDYSMIDLGRLILEKKKKAINYKDMYDEVAELKGFSSNEKDFYLAQFYTDLNLDGRFLTLGSGEWGLKKWYSVEQIDEIIQTDITPIKKKKKKKKKKVADVEDLEPSIDDQDDDLTEIPLELVKRAHNTKAEDEDDDTITLSDDDLIDDDDLDDDDYDDEDDDDYDEDDELDEE